MASMTETSGTTATPTVQQVARLVLPTGGMETWTQIMQGAGPSTDSIDQGTPIVMAAARFDDGTQIVGGVYKSGTPDYNVKFMWVFDANGNRCPGWPIDVSDDEDFRGRTYGFSLTPDGEETHVLNVVEAGS